MSDKDEIKEFFREKLQSHEVVPGKGVWANVSASITNSAVATSGAGAASLLKVAVAVVGISGLGVATYFLVQENKTSVDKELSVISHKTEENTEAKKVDVQNDSDNQKENVSSNTIIPPIDIPIIDDTEFSSDDLAGELRSAEIITSDETETGQEALSINSPTEVSEEIVTPNENETITEAAIAYEPEVENEINTTESEEVIESVQEEIEESEEASMFEEEITLPNVFTPNNDGINDYFEITMSEKQDFQIIVINQSNAVVYQSTSVNFRWDGRLQSGDPAPPGNYVYFISAKTLNGDDFVKSSALRIER